MSKIIKLLSLMGAFSLCFIQAQGKENHDSPSAVIQEHRSVDDNGDRQPASTTSDISAKESETLIYTFETVDKELSRINATISQIGEVTDSSK